MVVILKYKKIFVKKYLVIVEIRGKQSSKKVIYKVS